MRKNIDYPLDLPFFFIKEDIEGFVDKGYKCIKPLHTVFSWKRLKFVDRIIIETNH